MRTRLSMSTMITRRRKWTMICLISLMTDLKRKPEEEDYSRAIREIFGYDKRKYRNIDDDDDDIEEVNYARLMQEEARSARIGLMEDLEEERKEEEHRRRKMMAKRRQIADD